MENDFNRDSTSKATIDFTPNSVDKQVGNFCNTIRIPTPFSNKHEDIKNCFTIFPCITEKTEEYTDLLQAALIENNVIGSSTANMEPDWGYSEVPSCSTDYLAYKRDKLESGMVESEETIQKSEECVMDLSDKMFSSCLKRSSGFSSKQLESVEIESGKSKSEIKKLPEVVYDLWSTKNEVADIKEIDLIKNESKSKDFSSKQLVMTVGTDNNETKSDIDKWPEAIYDDWKIKNEEVDLEEEDLVEINSQSVSPGACNQEKHDEYKKNKKGQSKHVLECKKLEEIYLFKCDKCEFRSRFKNSLKQHILKHKNPEEVDLFRCVECEFVTRYKGVLKNHILKHRNPEEIDLFGCDTCDYTTRYKGGIKKHILYHKNPEEVNLFICDKCKFQTRFKGVLKQHVLIHETPKEEDLFKCDNCKYRTRFKSQLKRHQLRHKGLDEVHLFACDKCEYRTLDKSNLKKHGLRHKSPEELELFRCNKCKYQTRHKNVLKKHQLRHKKLEEVDLFGCDKCEYVTRFKDNLKSHVLVHKNPERVNVFGCDKCEFRTRYKHSINRHAFRHKNPKK